MIFGQESETLEFKKTTGELKESVVSVSAILNKHGKGELYFGIKPDGSVIGQQVAGSTLRDVSKAISDNLRPQIYPTIDMVKINNKNCIRVVFEGDNPPYAAHGRFYLRVADEDKQMSPEQIEEYFRRKISEKSDWDVSASNINTGEIDDAKLKAYINRANDVGRIDYDYTDKEDILKRLNLITDGKPCNAAGVVFGKYPSLEIQMAIFASKEKLTFNDIRRHNGTVNELIEIAEKYLRNNLRFRVVLDGSMQREEVPEIPLDAIREALFNSYCHKDYRIHQNNEVAIFSDRVEIYNPGTFPIGVTPEDYIEGVENSIHRNPLLAQLMYFTKDIESFGTGLRRIAEACNERGVKYEFQLRKYGFAVIFYRKSAHDDVKDGGIDVKKTIDTDRIRINTYKIRIKYG
jgi:ATP-dependent DNA helicase RecG